MTKKKKIQTGLGKGLGALLPSIEFREKGFKVAPEEQDENQTGGQLAMIEISKIHTNPYQPRQDFDPIALDGLKRSIEEHGVIQPITVRKDINGYELIAGERRLRASTAAGLSEIPAYILDLDRGVDSLAITIIENIQRENLNPIETASGYQRLIEECHLTQEQVAVKVGKDRSTITNFLRLLKLPVQIQDSLRHKSLSMGHARALLSLSSTERMLSAHKMIEENKLSVRATEALVKEIEDGKVKLDDHGRIIVEKKGRPKKNKPGLAPDIAVILEDTEDKLRHILGTQVKINPKSEESGIIELEFYSKDDLERIIELMSQIDAGAV